MKQRHLEVVLFLTGIATGWMLCSMVVPLIFGLM